MHPLMPLKELRLGWQKKIVTAVDQIKRLETVLKNLATLKTICDNDKVLKLPCISFKIQVMMAPFKIKI